VQDLKSALLASCDKLMSRVRIIIDAVGELEIAAIECDGQICDLFASHRDMPETYGAVVQAKPERILAAQGAALVSFDGQQGYWRDAPTKLDQAQRVRLQIKHAAHDEKLPSLSHRISILGRYLRHEPAGKGLKKSRRATGIVAPDFLQEMAGGWTLRAAAQHATGPMLHHEAHSLLRQGQATSLPALAYWQRAVLEADGIITQILVAHAALQRRVEIWLSDFAPDLLPAVTLARDVLDWEELITQATAWTLPLASGGSLTIEPTRAFWAVDVDSDETAQKPLAINSAAARLLVQQLRWRNMAGIIVVDFISMRTQKERTALLQYLRNAVRDDPATVEVMGMSKLGLVELTRTRRGRSLHDLLR
jgi:ribonuclease G